MNYSWGAGTGPGAGNHKMPEDFWAVVMWMMSE